LVSVSPRELPQLTPTDQRIRPAMRLTDPPTIATPNAYERRA
jgi:hypothetical protein